MRNRIRQIIRSIEPVDALESEHIANAMDWIDSGEEIFRIEKPATPPKHFVSYFVLIDPDRKKILLMDHINAGLFLPSGGHVEKDEDPRATVEREIQEELNLTAGHTDVSLWYVMKADSTKEINYDPQEFRGYKWFDYQEVLSTDISRLDPHMHRFSRKLFAEEWMARE